MHMIQRSFYIEKDLYQQAAELARQQELPTAQVLRSFIKAGVKKAAVKKTRCDEIPPRSRVVSP